MTTAIALITAAYREGNLIPITETPTSPELVEALDRLNGLILSYFGFGMGEGLQDWVFPQPQRTAAVEARYPQSPYPTDAPSGVTQYPPANSRVVWGAVPLTIWFPEQPLDGARMALAQGSGAGDGGAAGSTLTIDGNGRYIGTATTLQLTAPVSPMQWLYRADLATWTQVKPLAQTDDNPFPPDLDDLWIGLLAQRLAPRYNKTLAIETQQMIKRMVTTARTRFAQAQATVYKSDETPRGIQTWAPTWPVAQGFA